MSDSNNQPINLKEKAEKERQALLSRLMPKPKVEPKPAPVPAKPAPAPVKKAEPERPTPSRAQAIDQVYRNEPAANDALRNFERPAARPAGGNSGNAYRIATIVLALALCAAVGYWLFFAPDQGANPPAGSVAPKWYAVKLMNNEIYYGEVTDTSADPIVIQNVYYNYDQLNPGSGESATPESAAAASLKLVKRGKETHGPDGSMSIVRTQIVYLEPLKDDSKVLKAILDYEK
jgi:hypothetical protein